MDENQPRPGPIARWRERRRSRRAARGNSPEKAAERHTPKSDSIDVMLHAGGVERENRFDKK